LSAVKSTLRPAVGKQLRIHLPSETTERRIIWADSATKHSAAVLAPISLSK
jgi:hypothetical protein